MPEHTVVQFFAHRRGILGALILMVVCGFIRRIRKGCLTAGNTLILRRSGKAGAAGLGRARRGLGDFLALGVCQDAGRLAKAVLLGAALRLNIDGLLNAADKFRRVRLFLDLRSKNHIQVRILV